MGMLWYRFIHGYVMHPWPMDKGKNVSGIPEFSGRVSILIES
jgi:hypothetical protein